jgi:acetyl-CoA synthetase
MLTSGIDWRAQSYEESRRRHVFNIPERMNIAEHVCDRHADGSGRIALFTDDENGFTPIACTRCSSR